MFLTLLQIVITVNKEYDKYYKKNSDGDIRDGGERLLHILNDLKDNEFPIRLGHFSHCEAMAVDEYRNPKTRKGKQGTPLPYGTTLTLASGCFPMGWAKIAADAVS